MSEMNPSSFFRVLWVAIAVGFLLSLLSVVVAIAFTISDPSLEVSLVAHFFIWGGGTAIALLAMLCRYRSGAGRGRFRGKGG